MGGKRIANHQLVDLLVAARRRLVAHQRVREPQQARPGETYERPARQSSRCARTRGGKCPAV